MENNTHYTLTNGHDNFSTSHAGIGIREFSHSDNIQNRPSTFMSLYLSMNDLLSPPHGCIKFTYQVTQTGKSYGTISGRYCDAQNGMPTLSAWSNSNKVNFITDSNGNQKADFVLNPVD